ncbi:MAG: NAD-dependent epimerase/dehydratase family protein [Alphaproteobacteria bacterium]
MSALAESAGPGGAVARRAVRPVLVTGGAGFIGSHIADRVASSGRDVLVFDSLCRPGVAQNLEWLRKRHPRRLSTAIDDVRNPDALSAAADEAGAVFHMAAQVAVTTSLTEPLADFAVNLQATVALLESLRGRRTPLVFASTNKVYGDLADLRLERQGDAYRPVDRDVGCYGVGEDRGLDFHTPYGCSKGAADQYVLDYARHFDVPTAVFRMSCIYGPRQRGTEDQGWIAHFAIRALAGEEISIFGDGCQVRDILYVDDAVDAYMAALARMPSVAGHAFNLGGGPANAVSLRQVLGRIGALLGRPVSVRHDEWRSGDQRYYVSDTRKARRMLALEPPRDWRSGVADLVAWLMQEQPRSGAARAEPRLETAL